MPSEAPEATRSPEEPAPLQGRLHPATLAFHLAGQIRAAFFPVVVALVAGRKVEWYLWAVLGFTGLSLLWALARYFTFSYRVAGGELVTTHGLIGRQERHIPLSRVQDIRLEQSILQRAFGVVKVDIETAGGAGAEASLSVLSVADAERLRQAVFAQVRGGDSQAVPAAPAAATDLGAAPAVFRARSEGTTIWQVPLKDLALAGLTANHIGTVMAVLIGGVALLDDLLPKEAEKEFYRRAASILMRGVEGAGAPPWLVITVAAVIAVGAAAVFSVAGSLLLYHGFRLGRDGEDLHRSYGLLTHRASRLPRRRIQILKVEEDFFRRLLGLATLRADTAGGRAASAEGAEGSGTGRDVVVPVIPRRAVADVLPHVFPDIDPEPQVWRAARAIRREAVPGVYAGLILSAVLSCGLWQLRRFVPELPLSPWWGALPLALIPVSVVTSLLSYRHLGYSLGERFFRVRRGPLRREEYIVPVRNVQTVILRRTPFDRRLKLARLQVDTAGQTYTGGGPQIEHLPADEAAALARTLAHRAETQRYHWES